MFFVFKTCELNSYGIILFYKYNCFDVRVVKVIIISYTIGSVLLIYKKVGQAKEKMVGCFGDIPIMS